MMRATLLLAMLALAAPAPAQRPVYPGKLTIHVHDEDPANVTLTLIGEQVELRELLELLARKLNRELVGMGDILRDPQVDVFLQRREPAEALRWLLGSAGLSGTLTLTRITVQEELGPEPAPAQAFQRAAQAWQRIVAFLPDHPDADAHHMALAEAYLGIDETFRGSAIQEYEVLLGEFADSPYKAEAMLRSAQLYASLGDFRKAALRLSELSDLPADVHQFHAEARRELARALCNIGAEEQNPDQRKDTAHKALMTLEALDLSFPPRKSLERRERALLRGRALALTDAPIDALRALDVAATYSPAGQQDPEVLTVRAEAFERAELFGDAATAWLQLADRNEGPASERAFLRAAEAALAGGQELATLAIAAAAERRGNHSLRPFAREAEARLGILSAATGLSATQNIARAHALLEDRMLPEAINAFRLAWRKRTELSQKDLGDLARDYAKALDRDGLHLEALNTLRTAAQELETVFERRPLYVLASDLLEARGQYEAAIDAIEGKL